MQKKCFFLCAFRSFSYLYPPKWFNMKTTKLSFFLLAGLSFVFLSCEKEQFSKEAYDELVDFNFLVDNMDKEHDWCLTHSDTVTVISESKDIYALEVLTQNPYQSDAAEIAAEGVCSINEKNSGFQTTMSYTLPATQQTAYIAAKRQNGTYIGVVPFATGTEIVTIDIDALQTGNLIKSPKPQTFTYLYEEGFPLPGDFDFNDMVLRVSKSVSGPSQIDLRVTLEAVGTSLPYAAAIQLYGVKYDDVEKVEILEGAAMDQGYPLRRMMIESGKTLLKGRSGEAVINLFENGHYVMNQELNDVGSVQTLVYNTTTTDREDYSATAPSASRTYRVHFKNGRPAADLTFDQIDPFLIHEYNSGLWEVHTYPYKFSETLKNIYRGKQHYYDNHVSWALVVPKADFRYPVEGMSLGTYNSELGESFGPYTSFADWVKDHTQNSDWYNHPTYPQLLY